jgi:hypothetical protein
VLFDVLQKMNSSMCNLLSVILLAGCAVQSRPAADAGPKEFTEGFMKEIFRYDRDLFTDASFKKRYFSEGLTELIDEGIRDAVDYTPPPFVTGGHPVKQDRFNRTILNAWDTPTSYSVGEATTNSHVASVPVRYYWGPGSQYEGDVRVTNVSLVKEPRGWRVNDLITIEGKFVTAGSLVATLEKAKEGEQASSSNGG